MNNPAIRQFWTLCISGCHAQTVKDSSSMYKIEYVILIKNFLDPEGHQNPISGSKVTVILLKGWILHIGGASAVEGLGSTGYHV